MRLFIGIPIEKKIADSIESKLKLYKEKFNKQRWIEKKNYHITLLFLGEINEKNVKEIISLMEDSLKRVNALDLKIKNIDTFPNWKNPRILHMPIISNINKLHNIYKVLKSNMNNYLKKNNTNFTPHITLARVKQNQDFGILRNISYSKKMKVSKITLYQSILNKNIEYLPLYSIELV